MIAIQCQGCGNRYSVQDSQAGKVGRCRCGNKINVPIPLTVPMAVEPKPLQRPKQPILLERAKAPRRWPLALTQPARRFRPLLIAGGLLASLLVVWFVWPMKAEYAIVKDYVSQTAAHSSRVAVCSDWSSRTVMIGDVWFVNWLNSAGDLEKDGTALRSGPDKNGTFQPGIIVHCRINGQPWSFLVQGGKVVRQANTRATRRELPNISEEEAWKIADAELGEHRECKGEEASKARQQALRRAEP